MTTLATNGYRIGDRYTLLGKLGEGGESEVWRARDHLEGKEIALKVLRPEVAGRQGSWEALERQHEISRRLDHPMVLRVDRPVRDADVVALPMELAPGGDLSRLCGVSYLEIVPVVMEVAQALAHAHECGVVHRDLKPGNVLFDARGHVRLADFGATPSALSPFTASPQQLRGEPPTPADDIYGLGALAYELLSGHPPFYPHFERRRVLEEPAPPLKPAHLAPGRLVSLVMSMLGKHPRERPASMQAVLETLDMALNDTLTFTYDETPDALAARGRLHSASVQADEAEPLAPPPAPSLRSGSARRPTPPTMAPDRPTVDRPTAPPRPAAPERPAAANERRAPLERPSLPPRRPPLITPAPQPALAPATAPRVQQFASSPPHPAPPAASAAGPRAPAPAPAAAAAPAPAAAAAPAPAAAAAPAPAPAAPAPIAAPARTAPAGAPAAPLRADRWRETDMRALWGDIRVERVPNLMKIEPLGRSRWPWVLLAGVTAAAIAVFIVLHDSRTESSWAHPSIDELRTLAAPQVMKAVRGAVEAPLRAMQRHSAAAQGGGTPASPPQSLAGATGATSPNDATSNAAAPPSAASAANAATARPIPDQSAATAAVPERAPVRAPARSRAAAGSPSTALAAPAPASRPAAGAAQQHGQVSPGLAPLLADGRDAEAARDFSRAAQDYSQALALDPHNGEARAGLDRANAAFGAGAYSQAVGSGFAALGAGRLEEAQEDFQRARSIDAHGSEAAQGLREVAAALRTRDAAAARYRARSSLESRLQDFIDNPQRLNVAASRAEAASLIRQADSTQSSGPVLRSLAARLAILLPAYNKPVHLALVSDNLTQIEIPQIGSFGTFARREIDLKPGKYTVIGTRAGYREVRLDVTVAPGQTGRTISVRCEAPI